MEILLSIAFEGADGDSLGEAALEGAEGDSEESDSRFLIWSCFWESPLKGRSIPSLVVDEKDSKESDSRFLIWSCFWNSSLMGKSMISLVVEGT